MLKIHAKDLPKHGLTLILPSDPLFDQKISEANNDHAITSTDAMKSLSVFLENKTQQTVVAYRILWCFTKLNGETHCSKKTVSAPRALMEGENLPPEVDAQTGKIKPNSALLLSLFSIDDTGNPRIGVRVTSDEAEKIRQGFRPDANVLRDRAIDEFAKYSDVTVSIDGAFFEDGTFVGPDTTGFFDEIDAQVRAKRDLLSELASRWADSTKPKEQIFQYLQSIANQAVNSLNPKSTPQDHYNYYRKIYTQRILKSRERLGDEEGIAEALNSTKKPWRALTKKNESDR